MKAVHILALALLLLPALLLAKKGGVPGCTLKSTTTGCSCHQTTPTTSVSVVISGPSTLARNETGTYTVTVTDVAGSKGGIDIAASGGTLLPVSANMVQNTGELVSTTTFAVPSTYQFSYKPPALMGNTITLYATAKGTAFAAWNNAQNFVITVTAATSVVEHAGPPQAYRLEQNFPNPFNPATTIAFSIPTDAPTSVIVYDINGREAATLVNQTMSAGRYTVRWNAENFASGIYYYRLVSGTFTATKKLVLQK